MHDVINVGGDDYFLDPGKTNLIVKDGDGRASVFSRHELSCFEAIIYKALLEINALALDEGQ